MLRNACLALLAVISFGTMDLVASDDLAISPLIMSSKTMAELEAKLREHNLLTFADEVPGVLLAHVRAFPSDETTWRALYHYKTQADGAYSEGFSFDCFLECITDPKIFANRYIQGDDDVFSLLQSAITGVEAAIPAYASWPVNRRKIALKEAFKAIAAVPAGTGEAASRREKLIRRLSAIKF